MTCSTKLPVFRCDLATWTASMLTLELVAIMVGVRGANLEDHLGCDHARDSREPTASRADGFA